MERGARRAVGYDRRRPRTRGTRAGVRFLRELFRNSDCGGHVRRAGCKGLHVLLLHVVTSFDRQLGRGSPEREHAWLGYAAGAGGVARSERARGTLRACPTTPADLAEALLLFARLDLGERSLDCGGKLALRIDCGRRLGLDSEGGVGERERFGRGWRLRGRERCGSDSRSR